MTASMQATADSLLGTVGDTFTFYYMHSQPDGKTVVETVVGSVSAPNVIDRLLLGGAAKHMRILWLPADFKYEKMNAPDTYSRRLGLTLVLQGDLILEVSDGKVYRIKPGNVLIAEDTGDHRITCESTNKTMGCVQVVVEPEDPAKFFENVKLLRIPPPKK